MSPTCAFDVGSKTKLIQKKVFNTMANRKNYRQATLSYRYYTDQDRTSRSAGDVAGEAK